MNNTDLISRSRLLENIEKSRKAHASVRFRLTVGDMEQMIKGVRPVDAEPVRHEGNATFVKTNDLDSYADRVIVGQGNLCKVYYADEPVRHGRWGRFGKTHYRIVCSDCKFPTPFKKQANGYHLAWKSNYCPNCGAKMEQDDN